MGGEISSNPSCADGDRWTIGVPSQGHQRGQSSKFTVPIAKSRPLNIATDGIHGIQGEAVQQRGGISKCELSPRRIGEFMRRLGHTFGDTHASLRTQAERFTDSR